MASASKKLGNGIISREEVETWNLEALKDFCRCRGDKVIGSKEGLVFRAYILYNYCVLKDQVLKKRNPLRLSVNI